MTDEIIIHIYRRDAEIAEETQREEERWLWFFSAKPQLALPLCG
jgi:hypothetical protein